MCGCYNTVIFDFVTKTDHQTLQLCELSSDVLSYAKQT